MTPKEIQEWFNKWFHVNGPHIDQIELLQDFQQEIRRILVKKIG